MSIQYEHLIRLGFEAARQLPDRAHPENALRHAGHSFELTVATPMPREISDGPRCTDGLVSLRAHIDEVLRDLDYALLNERLTEPDDAALLDEIERLAGGLAQEGARRRDEAPVLDA